MEKQEVVDRFLSLKYAGVLKGSNGIGVSKNDVCGDSIKIYIKVEDNKITSSKFKAFGSPTMLVLCDLFCENIINKTIEDAKNYAEKEFSLVLEDFFEDKTVFSSFFVKALDVAVKKYTKKVEREQKVESTERKINIKTQIGQNSLEISKESFKREETSLKITRRSEKRIERSEKLK